MKKQILISLISVSSVLTLNAQWTGTNPIYTSAHTGIGTSIPQASLQVTNTIGDVPTLRLQQYYTIFDFSGHSISLQSQPTTTQVPYIEWKTPNGTRQAYMGWNPTVFNLTLDNGFNFAITNGNVLIGKTSQTNSGYKLDIAGSVRADEIVVNTTGADFVFDGKYKLRSLAEVALFIKQNKHLPEIATANEMQENGVNMGKMQSQLLQKIEELTLYALEQDKKLQEQDKKIEELKVLINQMSK